MSGKVFCAACDWSEDKHDAPDLMKCPICGRPTMRGVTSWDALREDLLKILTFVIVAASIGCIWIWLTYPYVYDGMSYQNVAYVRVRSATVTDTPSGAVATFLIVNESHHHLAKLNLELKFHGRPSGPALSIPAKGLHSIIVADLTAHSEQRCEVELGEGRAADFFGWNAEVVSFSLPPGYWNRRLQQAISVRVQGQRQTDEMVPSPFDEPAPRFGNR